MPEQLLDILHHGGTYGNLWTKSDKASHWFKVGDELPVIDRRKHDIYFGVHPQREDNDAFHRSTIANVEVVNCVFSEFDFKDFPGETPKEREKNCREHLNNLTPEPSAKVASGGGYHYYWFFNEPWEMDEQKLQLATDLQAKWVEHTGGDNGAKDLARVLRLPGTFNHKYEPPREVKYVSLNGNKYTPKELGDYCGGVSTRKVYTRAPKVGTLLSGDRRGQVMIGIAGHNWQRWNINEDTLRAICAAVNKHMFDEPVSDTRQEGIVKQVARYPRDVKTKFDLETFEGVFEKLGWTFRRNLAGNLLEVNGCPMDDYDYSEILFKTNLVTSQPVSHIERAFKTLAKHNSYHEVIEVLNNFEYDGDDHIGKLCDFIESEPAGWLETVLTRWLIGCVAKALHVAPEGVQTFMLVLDGAQGIGKSHFVRSLSLPFGYSYFIEGPLSTGDKDTDVRLLRKFIWEVSELGATFRRSDLEALKALISKVHVTVRRAYGRFDMEGQALCSLVGTVNDSGGLLSDMTGNRRYVIVKCKSFDWGYSKNIDMNQVWAQAVHLYKKGTSWNLSKDEVEQQNDVNAEYMVVDPVLEAIKHVYKIDPVLYEDDFTPTFLIAERLGRYNLRMPAGALYRAIANALAALGCGSPRQARHDGEVRRGYYGLRSRIDPVTEV